MKTDNYKSCKRKNCPYYEFKICPHRRTCDYSKELVWNKQIKGLGNERVYSKKGYSR